MPELQPGDELRIDVQSPTFNVSRADGDTITALDAEGNRVEVDSITLGQWQVTIKYVGRQPDESLPHAH